MRVPAYFDYLIDARRSGRVERCVHLGYWEDPPGEDAPPASPEAWRVQAFALAQHRLDEKVLALADLRPGLAVLDAGCGFGGTLEAINSRQVRMALHGLNIDPRQLELCAGLVAGDGNRFAWMQGDACALPFPDGAFDRVLCVEAMFHFPSRRRFFQEAARVLRPGGLLVGTDLIVSADARALERPGFPIRGTLDEGYGPWPDFWGDDADHGRLAAEAGLQSAVLEDIAAQVRPSHRFTTPGGTSLGEALAAPQPNVALRAALMLKWLHEEGHLRYPLFRFDKPSA